MGPPGRPGMYRPRNDGLSEASGQPNRAHCTPSAPRAPPQVHRCGSRTRPSDKALTFHRHNLAEVVGRAFSLVAMHASRFRDCACAKRNRIRGGCEKWGNQRPRATLRREVLEAQEVLQAYSARSVSWPLKRRLRAAPRPGCPQSVTLGWSETLGAGIPGASLAR